MCDILLEMPFEFSHVHSNAYFTVNKFDFFLFSVYTNVFIIKFFSVINESIFITQTRVLIGYCGFVFADLRNFKFVSIVCFPGTFF